VPAAPQVIVYVSRHCPACRQLSSELVECCRGSGVEPEVRDVLAELEAAARLGVSQPPAVVIDGRLFGQGAAVLRKLKLRFAA